MSKQCIRRPKHIPIYSNSQEKECSRLWRIEKTIFIELQLLKTQCKLLSQFSYLLDFSPIMPSTVDLLDLSKVNFHNFLTFFSKLTQLKGTPRATTRYHFINKNRISKVVSLLRIASPQKLFRARAGRACCFTFNQSDFYSLGRVTKKMLYK